MRIIFIGTGEIGLPSLRALLESPQVEVVAAVTQPDRPAGRSQTLRPPAVKTLLAGSGLPVLQPRRIREETAVAALRALAPDVIVVMAYGQILPRAVLETPRLACINLHASLLPRHRGAAPIQAAILAGDAESGITVMHMDEGLDTGDILLQQRLTIAPDETGGSLHDRLAALAPGALLEALPLIAEGRARRLPQNSAYASYAPKLERADGRIDWQESAVEIERRIRAFDPWPGSFTILHDDSGYARQLKIFRATLVDREGAPGTFLPPAEELIVATGKGALRLEEVQLEGKRRMAGAEFFRGFSSPSLRF